MRLGLLLTCALLAAAIPVALGAQPQESPAAANQTPQRTLDALIAAINDETVPLEAFAASAFTPAALANESVAQRAEMLRELRLVAGGVEILERHGAGPRMAEAIVRTRRGGRFARLVLFTGRDQPERIAQLFVLAARDPAKVAAEAFPVAPVPPADIPSKIVSRINALSSDDLFSGAVLVARGDEVIVREARGFAEQSWRIPNRVDTRFNIASIGKMFTAAAVMALVEQGKLSLDDTLALRVPAFAHREAAGRITLRHLLQHRAGLGPWDVREFGGDTTAEAVASMTAPPEAEPGIRFGYSNAGYVLLAAAIEQATGMAFPDAIAKLVFEPAGMTATGFWPVTAIVPERATGYLRPASDPLGFGPRYSNEQFLGFGGDGSGGAYSTVEDLFAFHRALATGRIVNEPALRAMVDQAVEFPGTARPMRYGLGLRLESCAGVPTLGHGGGGENSGTDNATYASLDGEWTVIVLANYDPPAADTLSHAICEFVHGQP